MKIESPYLLVLMEGQETKFDKEQLTKAEWVHLPNGCFSIFIIFHFPNCTAAAAAA